jgi:hypothetical protein
MLGTMAHHSKHVRSIIFSEGLLDTPEKRKLESSD